MILSIDDWYAPLEVSRELCELGAPQNTHNSYKHPIDDESSCTLVSGSVQYDAVVFEGNQQMIGVPAYSVSELGALILHRRSDRAFTFTVYFSHTTGEWITAMRYRFKEQTAQKMFSGRTMAEAMGVALAFAFKNNLVMSSAFNA